MRIIFALLIIITGLVLVFSGYRLARIIIPLWGFVSGLAIGGAIASDVYTTSFLGSVLGIATGLFLGLIFALLAYLYYFAAVIILAGTLGYWLAGTFMLMLGFDYGMLVVSVGLAAGLVVGFVSAIWNAPKYFLIVITSVAGAVSAIGGLMLLFNQFTMESFSYAAAHTAVTNSWAWSITALAMAVAGMVVQWQTVSRYDFEKWGTELTPMSPKKPLTGAGAE